MRLPTEGLDHDSICAALADFKSHDLDWRQGRTWAYVYPVEPDVEAIGKLAYTSFLTENALDPTVFPSCMAMENQLVAIGAAHLGGDPATVAGNFTTGGTESILLACKTARDRARALRPEVTRPEVILPVTAHAAFHKACAYFDLVPVRVEVDPQTFKASGEAVRAAITDQTILVVASAPSYAHGVVDDVPSIAAVAAEHGLLCHVDACMGGWLLPWFQRLGHEVTPFDFRVPGVTSLSMDLHKYAFCPKGASLVLYRDAAVREYQLYACSGWTGYTVINTTIQSTKSGGPVAAAWAVMHYLGEAGYLRYARRILDAMHAIIDGCNAIEGLRVMGRPDFCLIAVASEEVNVFHVADEMRQRGWYIQPQLGFGAYPRNIHLSVNPGVVDSVDAMLSDLADAVEAARSLASEDLEGLLGEALGGDGPMAPETFERLLARAGVEGGALPERMARINEILDALPVPVNEALLKRFFASLNQYRA